MSYEDKKQQGGQGGKPYQQDPRSQGGQGQGQGKGGQGQPNKQGGYNPNQNK